MPGTDSAAVEQPHPDDPRLGLRTLRRYTEGVLQFSERRAPARFVLDRATGQIVMPVEPAALDAREHVLHLPDETACILSVLISIETLDNPSAHEAPDRWQAYHACHAPPAGKWIIAAIEAAKTETIVFPGDELAVPNRLKSCEPKLVRALNAQRANLSAACERLLNLRVPDPVCVGIDPLGVDVRARFGVLRLEFESPAETEPQAQDAIRKLLH